MLSISLFLWGCGSGGGGSAPPPDTIPPVSSISCSPLANAAGWNNKDVSCKLTAIDNGGSIGVHEIRFRINSSPEFIVLGSSATVNVTEDGETTIIYFAVDFVNNQEIPNSKAVLIDKSLPIITGIISPSPSSTGWNTTNVTVKFTCSDGPSGVASCPPDVDISTDVVGKVITGNATDLAGNRALASLTVNLDKGPPNVLSTAPSDKATEVEINTNISAIFTEPMNPQTLTQNTFILKSGDSNIPGAVSLSGTIATFTPSSKLSFSTSYTATLTSNVRDLAGNPLSTYRWSFDTRERAWGTATTIENNDLPASNPQVAMDGSGNAMAVWVQGNDIWANRYVAGTGWSPSEAARTEGDTRPALTPQVAMDLIGNAIAVWVQGNDIWANRDALGSVWSTSKATQIEANAGIASNPQLTMDATGNAMAVWVQTGDPNLGSPDTQNGVWANRFALGSGWSANPTDIRGPGQLGSADSSQVAMDGFGNAMAVWVQRNHVFANRYSLGSVWSRLNTLQIEANTGAALNAQVGMDAFGNAMAVWMQNNHIWAKRFIASILRWEDNASQVESNVGTASNPQIAIDGSGNAIAVWVQDSHIWANRYAVGSDWSPSNATRIETNNGAASNPQVVMDASGNAVAVWVQGIDIWANRYVVGRGWGTATLLENSSEPTSNPQVAMNASGNATVVWVQSDGKSISVWANGFN